MTRKLPSGRPHRQSKAAVRSRRHGLVPFLLAVAVWGTACGPGADTDPGAASSVEEIGAAPVRLGIDVLLTDSLPLVAGQRVGLITNHTGVSWPGAEAPGGPPSPARPAVSTIDRLHRAEGVELVALFGPEHGIRGRVEGGERVADDRDPTTGVPVYSLYGDTRQPTPAMLQGLDLLLFDIQDIGARYYTYVWTMALAMEAAGEAGVGFVVLDRPNPIGGRLVQGNVLDPDFATFVGLYPVPMRHGLTVGELARMLVGHFGIDVELHVIPMAGWSRTLWYDDTGLPFIPPSPNMPSVASATHYPGTCLFEGTNLSVGRGTDVAFQQIGAPWLDAEIVADTLNAAGLDGVRFEAVSFVPDAPGDGKYDGETVQGIRFIATDRSRYDPTRAAIAALAAIHARHPDRVQWHVAHFDRLAGTDRVRQGILDGRPTADIVASWAAQVENFEALRRPYLVY